MTDPTEMARGLVEAVQASAEAIGKLAYALSAAVSQDTLEAIADRRIAFEHARTCAGLTWPWQPRETRHIYGQQH